MYIANGNGLSDKIGGSLTRTINIAKRLERKGHVIYFLTTIGGFKACKREKLNVKYYVITTSLWRKTEGGLFDRFLSYVISTLASPFVISRLPKVDIIYTDSDYFCDTIPAVLYKNRFRTAKWIAMTHHIISISTCGLRDFIVTMLSSAIQKLGYHLFKKHADGIFVLGTESGRMIKTYLVSIGIPPVKIQYVLNGVDMKLVESIKNEKKLYDACFLGGLRPSKGLYEIVPVWKEVCSHKKDAALLLIGNIAPVYLNTLQDQLYKNELAKNVIVLGFVETPAEKIAYLKSSKLFFFPSHAEGFGIAILEAMACGLPVVAWDLPLYRKLFPKGMMKIPFGDIQKCANAILELLMNSGLCETISGDAIEVASKYDWDKVVKKELELMEHFAKRKTNALSKFELSPN